MTTNSAISFDNTKLAFAYKSDKQLKKARFLFSLMRSPLLVKVAVRLTPWVIKVGLPVKGMIRRTIFAQFVGGESMEQTSAVSKKLGEYNVKVILDYGVEGKEGEANFESACEQFIRVIRYAATQDNIPFMSVKVTGFARFGLLANINALMKKQEGSLMKRLLGALEELSAVKKKSGT